jgi:hypothetical protein
METMYVDVKVGRTLKDFIVHSNGSDILSPEKDTVLWCLVKQHLLTVPGSYTSLSDRSEYIQIELLKKHGAQTFSAVEGKKIQVNTLFRTYFDKNGQEVIRKHFNKHFKNVFRTYMAGCLNNNPDIKVIEAITEFLLDNEINVNPKDLQKLQKDWYRHRLKLEGKKICPICF